MSFNNDDNKTKNAVTETVKPDSDRENIQSAVDDVMKKFDRESNTRVWEGTPRLVVDALLIAFSLFCM